MKKYRIELKHPVSGYNWELFTEKKYESKEEVENLVANTLKNKIAGVFTDSYSNVIIVPVELLKQFIITITTE